MQNRILNGPLLFLAVHVYAPPLIPIWALGLASLAVVLVSVLVQHKVSSSPWISSLYQLLDLTLTVLSLHKLLGETACIFLFMPFMICCMLDLPVIALQATHFLLALVVGTVFLFLPSGDQYAVDSDNTTATWLLALLAGMPTHHTVSGSGSYLTVLLPKLLYAGLCTAGLVSAASASALYVRMGIAFCVVLDRVKMFQVNSWANHTTFSVLTLLLLTGEEVLYQGGIHFSGSGPGDIHAASPCCPASLLARTRCIFVLGASNNPEIHSSSCGAHSSACACGRKQ